jgi:exodeoxyribonuclease V alpha subunit
VETTGGEETMVGKLAAVNEGMYIQAEGDYVNHRTYGLQFQIKEYELSHPVDLDGIERYLSSGLVKGIGPATAKRIVERFKEDTLRILAEEPERLQEINRISLKKAREIGEAYRANREYEDAVILLGKYGIKPELALKIYKYYGNAVRQVIRENPYKLVEDIQGITFRKADEIAGAVGVPQDSEERIRSAIHYILTDAMMEGQHLFLPEPELVSRCCSLLRTESGADYGFDPEYDPDYGASWDTGSAPQDFRERVSECIFDMAMDGRLVLKDVKGWGRNQDFRGYTDPRGEDFVAVYSYWNYQNEAESAKLLLELQMEHKVRDAEFDRTMQAIEEELSLNLDPTQKKAVRSAVCSGVAVITGGPGTGKTTIINAIIRFLEKHDLEVELAAPTGRAAKRITEATGVPARTIHRLLEFSGDPEADTSRKSFFARNEENPLECDAVIVDEVSMVDMALFHSLLLAIPRGTRLILVGDADQLPSVGAGNCLHDIIRSGCFPVETLSTIFRQSENSRIVEYAHKIKNGEPIILTNKDSSDFFFIQKNGTEEVLSRIASLIMDELPPYCNVKPDDIQILTPLKKHPLGVAALNKFLQETLNPYSKTKREMKRGDVTFREGDKVMQIKNDYKLEWRIPPCAANNFLQEEGIGVFNGDMGHITLINDFDQVVVVRFDDGREVSYPFPMMDELAQAFAITIHKSQGSEYPLVIMPLYYANERMMNRKLFYTAVTRAKTAVVLVGDLNMVNRMVANRNVDIRYTGLDLRLAELKSMYL